VQSLPAFALSDRGARDRRRGDPDDPETGERIDFMRILWDMHTDPAATKPTFTVMLQDWLASDGQWEEPSAFTVVDAKATRLDDSPGRAPPPVL
jgi:hypothetical protein